MITVDVVVLVAVVAVVDATTPIATVVMSVAMIVEMIVVKTIVVTIVAIAKSVVTTTAAVMVETTNGATTEVMIVVTELVAAAAAVVAVAAVMTTTLVTDTVAETGVEMAAAETIANAMEAVEAVRHRVTIARGMIVVVIGILLDLENSQPAGPPMASLLRDPRHASLTEVRVIEYLPASIS